MAWSRLAIWRRSSVQTGEAVGEQGRVEERHVRCVRDDAGVQHGVVRQRAVGPQPHPLLGLLRGPDAPRAPGRRSGCRSAGADRTTRRAPPGRASIRVLKSGRSSGLGTSASMAIWWSRPLSGRWKLACRLKMAFAVLDGDDPPCGEALAVADAIDLVQDRHGGVAGAEEVGVQRVDEAGRVVHRAGGGHEGLPGHLAAEDPLAARPRATGRGRCSPRWPRDRAGR